MPCGRSTTASRGTRSCSARRCSRPRASCADDQGARELLARFNVRRWDAGHLADATSTSTPPRSCRRCEDRADLRGPRRRGRGLRRAQRPRAGRAVPAGRADHGARRRRRLPRRPAASASRACAGRVAITAQSTRSTRTMELHHRAITARTWRSPRATASRDVTAAADLAEIGALALFGGLVAGPLRPPAAGLRRPACRASSEADMSDDCGVCAGDVPPLIGQVLTGTGSRSTRPRGGCGRRPLPRPDVAPAAAGRRLRRARLADVADAVLRPRHRPASCSAEPAAATLGPGRGDGWRHGDRPPRR